MRKVEEVAQQLVRYRKAVVEAKVGKGVICALPHAWPG